MGATPIRSSLPTCAKGTIQAKRRNALVPIPAVPPTHWAASPWHRLLLQAPPAAGRGSLAPRALGRAAGEPSGNSGPGPWGSPCGEQPCLAGLCPEGASRGHFIVKEPAVAPKTQVGHWRARAGVLLLKQSLLRRRGGGAEGRLCSPGPGAGGDRWQAGGRPCSQEAAAGAEGVGALCFCCYANSPAWLETEPPTPGCCHLLGPSAPALQWHVCAWGGGHMVRLPAYHPLPSSNSVGSQPSS